MTAETAPISREALRLAREQRRLSQRELGKRVAERLGRAEATRAFQVRLSRIETGDEITEEDRELVDALAAELALGEDDLATPPRWIWFKTTNGRLSFVALGLRQIAFSSPEKAYDARDALALEHEYAQPFRDAQLFPIHGTALTNAVMDVNFGPGLSDDERQFLVALDPDQSDLLFLWTLQIAIGGDPDLRAVFEAALARTYGTGDLITHAARFARDYPGFEVELNTLHQLALRRLKHAPPEGAHLLESWRREEEALFGILDRIHELRHEDRAAVLRGEPRDEDEPDA